MVLIVKYLYTFNCDVVHGVGEKQISFMQRFYLDAERTEMMLVIEWYDCILIRFVKFCTEDELILRPE